LFEHYATVGHPNLMLLHFLQSTIGMQKVHKLMRWDWH